MLRSHKLNKYRFNLLQRSNNNQLNNNNSRFFLSDFWDKRVHFFGASFRAIIFSLDRLCNERLFAPFVRLLSFNSVVKQKSAAAVRKKDRLRFQARTTDYCAVENSLPLPIFQVRPRHILVCHNGPIFQISLIYAFVGCPQSVRATVCTKSY